MWLQEARTKALAKGAQLDEKKFILQALNRLAPDSRFEDLNGENVLPWDAVIWDKAVPLSSRLLWDLLPGYVFHVCQLPEEKSLPRPMKLRLSSFLRWLKEIDYLPEEVLTELKPAGGEKNGSVGEEDSNEAEGTEIRPVNSPQPS